MKISGVELKSKPKKVIATFAITFQLLAFFGGDLGISDSLKPIFLCLTVFGYSFFILPHLNVWQKVKSA